VWRRGFAEWTRAEDVPEIEQRLAPLLARPTGRLRRGSARVAPNAAAAEPAPASPSAGASPRRTALIVGSGAAVLLVAFASWRLASRVQGPAVPLPSTAPSASLPAAASSEPPATTVPPAVGHESTPAPAGASGAPAVAAPAGAPRPRATPQQSILVSDEEASLPSAELRKLRGVAVWSGESLKLTVYNGTSWRVTELSVRVERFVGDEFVSDGQPLQLLPPAGAVDSGVADLLQRVAPDRKKPGLNPLDTGAFVGRAGPPPENMRWEIESARGYPPAAPQRP
jgi:hypothetical protein